MWTAIGIIAFLAGLFLLGQYLRKSWPFGGLKPKTAAQNMQDIINTLTVQPQSPDMPFVLSRNPLTSNQFAGIREAFRERTEKAKTKGWTEGFDPVIYTILIFPSVRDFNDDGVFSPSFQVFFDAGNSYDESIYDQVKGKPGGWTYAAEQVLTNNGVPTDKFVIAETDDYPYLVASVSNGLDHIFAYKNDPVLYEATKDHSKGGGHPLW